MRVVGNKFQPLLGLLVGELIVEQNTHQIISIGFDEDYKTDGYGNPGLIIEKRPTKLTKLNLQRVYFKSHNEVNDLDITITDGVQTQVETISALADEEIIIDLNFITDNLSITITYECAGVSQTVEPYTGNISPFDRWGCSDCSGHHSEYLRMRSLDFEGDESLVWYGIRADVQLICDTEKMICLLAHKNKVVFLYALGVELMNEFVASDRLNFLTLNNKDWAAAKSLEWEARYKEMWAVNGQSIRRSLMNEEKDCFTCGGTHVQYGIG